MKPVLRLIPVALLLASCGTVVEWHEMQSAPMTIGECYDGLVYIAMHDGFRADSTGTDRGYGRWQSRWRERQLGLNRPGRYRLRAEVMIDDGSTEKGWIVRYVVEQQKVKDLAHSRNPIEDDWSDDGQDAEREALFTEKLVRRIGPKTP